SDVGTVEASADGETWEGVVLELRADEHRWSAEGAFSGFSGRRWIEARAALPEGTSRLRWSYASDPEYQGRGVYVDGIRVREGRRVVFDDSRPHDRSRIDAEGWKPSRN